MIYCEDIREHTMEDTLLLTLPYFISQRCHHLLPIIIIIMVHNCNGENQINFFVASTIESGLEAATNTTNTF